MKDNIIIVKALESNYEKLREIFFNVRKSTFNWLEPDEIKLSDFDDSTKGELILIALINDEITVLFQFGKKISLFIIYLLQMNFKAME